jgi:EmrB/QacA subfamily drug resistance transporter
VNTALPAIQANLSVTVTQLQWVMTALLLALTAFMVICGKLADLYGRRLCLYVGMGLFALSSLGIGFAPEIYSLIGFRFVQGIAIAILYTAPIALIPSLFPENLHGRAAGILFAVNGLGLAVGPVIGGFIVSTLGWRWIFFINLPVILISFLLCWKNLTESKSATSNRKIDGWGFILLLIALPAGILALVQGESWGWTSVPTLSLSLTSLIGLLAFYFVETKVSAPIIEFHLLANRIFVIGVIANFALAMFYSVNFFLIPLYLHYIRGMQGYQIGLALLPATCMVTALSSTSGRIVDKYGPKWILCCGLCLFLATTFLQLQLTTYSPLWLILLTYLLFGTGWACILSPSFVAALSSIPKDSAGVAMGTMGTLHNLGGAIGLALGTLIYNAYAKFSLVAALKNYPTPSGTWIDQAVTNNEQAMKILRDNTHLDFQTITPIFQHYFLAGFHGAMLLLLATTSIALLAVFFGLTRKTAKN